MKLQNSLKDYYLKGKYFTSDFGLCKNRLLLPLAQIYEKGPFDIKFK